MASPTDDSRKTIADSIVKITNRIYNRLLIFSDCTSSNDSVIRQFIVLLTALLSTPFDGSEGNSTFCRMNSSDYLSLNGEKSINDATIVLINEFGTGRDVNFSQGVRCIFILS